MVLSAGVGSGSVDAAVTVGADKVAEEQIDTQEDPRVAGDADDAGV